MSWKGSQQLWATTGCSCAGSWAVQLAAAGGWHIQAVIGVQSQPWAANAQRGASLPQSCGAQRASVWSGNGRVLLWVFCYMTSPPPQPQKMFLWLGFKLIAMCCFSLWSMPTQVSGAITVRCLTVWAVLVQNHRPLYTAAKRAFTFLSCSANGAVSVLQQSVTTVTVINKSVWARKLYSSRKEWKLIYKLFEYAALLPVELHHSCLCSSLSVVINLQPAALWARQPGRWKECFHSSFRWSFRVELAKNKPLNATGPSTIHSTAGGSVRLISSPARFRTIRLFSLFWWNCVCWYLHIVSEFVWAGRDSPGSRSSGIESQHHEDVFRDYFIFSLWISETAHQMVGWSVFPLLGTTLFSLFFFFSPFKLKDWALGPCEWQK